MKKIAYLMNAPIPSKRANSVHVMKMCQAFSKKDIDVTLYCEREIDTEIENEEVFNKYKITSEFNINPIKTTDRNIRLIPKFLKNAIMMYKNVKKSDVYDFLYGRALFSLYFLRKKNKFMYESHIAPINLVFKHFEKRILQSENCIKFVVISQALKEEYVRIFPWVNPDKIFVLHDGADYISQLERENIVEKKLINHDKNNEVIIGYVGHLYPGKCMEVIIKIAKLKPSYTIHVAGGTDEWVSHWKKEIDNEEIKNIKLYGYIENNEVDEYYKAIDIFLLPFSKNIFFDKSKKRNIGSWISPLKLFEAMSHKKAIVSSKISTIEEVLTHGEDALINEPDDISEWINNIDKLVKDIHLRNKLGENAQQKLINDYTWEKRVEKIVDEFEKAGV